MTLRTRDEHLRELMDDPLCAPARLRRTLQRFGIVNRAVSSWGRVYENRIRPVLADAAKPACVLDIGCGGGDVLRRVVKRARQDGFSIEGLGIDPNPGALAVANEPRRALAAVSFRLAYSHDLVADGASFDIVMSNHLLHHLDADALPRLLSDSEHLATRISLHSDIARGRLA